MTNDDINFLVKMLRAVYSLGPPTPLLEQNTFEEILISDHNTDIFTVMILQMKGHMILCAMLVMTILAVTIQQTRANPFPSSCLYGCSEQTGLCQRFCRGRNCRACATFNSNCRNGCRRKR